MVRGDDGSLEQRPRGFDGVGMTIATHPFFLSVIDGSVHGVRVTAFLVGLQFVDVDRGSFVGTHGVQKRGDLTLPVAISLTKPKLPAALNSTQDGGGQSPSRSLGQPERNHDLWKREPQLRV